MKLFCLQAELTSYVLPPLLQVFPGAESVAVEFSPEVVSLAAEPVLVVAPEVDFVVEPEVASLAVEPEVAPVAVEFSDEVVVFVAAPEVASVAAVSVPGVAEPQASVGIAVAFAALVPVSVVVVEVDSPGHPRFFAFPSIDYYANSASSVEVVGAESGHNSIGARTNYGPCNVLSSQDLHQNRTLEHYYNNPSPGHNTVSDTNGHAMDATTSHSRKRGLHLSREQRKHRQYQAALSHPVVRQTRWDGADQN